MCDRCPVGGIECIPTIYHRRRGPQHQPHGTTIDLRHAPRMQRNRRALPRRRASWIVIGEQTAPGAIRPRRPRVQAEPGRTEQPSRRPLALPGAATGTQRRERDIARRSSDAARAARPPWRRTRWRRDHRQGREPPPHRILQSPRPGTGRVDGQGVGAATGGHANQRQRRRRPRRIWVARRAGDVRVLSGRHAGSQRARDRAPGSQRLAS